MGEGGVAGGYPLGRVDKKSFLIHKHLLCCTYHMKIHQKGPEFTSTFFGLIELLLPLEGRVIDYSSSYYSRPPHIVLRSISDNYGVSNVRLV